MPSTHTRTRTRTHAWHHEQKEKKKKKRAAAAAAKKKQAEETRCAGFVSEMGAVKEGGGGAGRKRGWGRGGGPNVERGLVFFLLSYDRALERGGRGEYDDNHYGGPEQIGPRFVSKK